MSVRDPLDPTPLLSMTEPSRHTSLPRPHSRPCSAMSEDDGLNGLIYVAVHLPW